MNEEVAFLRDLTGMPWQPGFGRHFDVLPPLTSMELGVMRIELYRNSIYLGSMRIIWINLNYFRPLDIK